MVQSVRNILRSRNAGDIIFIIFLVFVCVLGDFYIARSIRPLADAVQNINELKDFFSGNIFLRGWVLASDNFYGTDLPFFVIGALIFGYKTWLIYAVPTVIFSLLIISCIVLVVQSRRPGISSWPGALIIIYLIGLPFQSGAEMLMVSDFHVATIMFCLFALILIQPILDGGRIGRLRSFVFTLLLFLAEASDPFASIFFGLPLLALLSLRFILYKEMRKEEVHLFIYSSACLIISTNMPVIMNLIHGFSIREAFSNSLIHNPGDLLVNTAAILEALRLLFNAEPSKVGGTQLLQWMAISRVIVEVIAVSAVIIMMSKIKAYRTRGTVQLIVICALSMLIIDMFSHQFNSAVSFGPGFPNAATRYVVPMFVFLSIAGAILIPELTIYRKNTIGRNILFLMTFVFLVLFGGCAVRAIIKAAHGEPGIDTASESQLAKWLYEQGYRYGVGDYYTTQLVRALSSQTVMADPVILDRGQLVPFRFWTDTSRFDEHKRPQFVIYPLKNVYGVNRIAAERTFGVPSRVLNIQGYEVVLINSSRK